MSQSVGRDRSNRPRGIAQSEREARVLAARRKRDMELEEIERLHRPRTKGRLHEALEETLTNSLSRAVQGNKPAERILVGHRREMDRLTRESTRENADIDRDLVATEKLLHSENDTLTLLRKQKQRMEESKTPQPTEVVERQIVESERQIFKLQEHESAIKQKRARLTEDLERERREQLENVSRQLKEAK